MQPHDAEAQLIPATDLQAIQATIAKMSELYRAKPGEDVDILKTLLCYPHKRYKVKTTRTTISEVMERHEAVRIARQAYAMAPQVGGFMVVVSHEWFGDYTNSEIFLFGTEIDNPSHVFVDESADWSVLPAKEALRIFRGCDYFPPHIRPNDFPELGWNYHRSRTLKLEQCRTLGTHYGEDWAPRITTRRVDISGPIFELEVWLRDGTDYSKTDIDDLLDLVDQLPSASFAILTENLTLGGTLAKLRKVKAELVERQAAKRAAEIEAEERREQHRKMLERNPKRPPPVPQDHPPEPMFHPAWWALAFVLGTGAWFLLGS